MNKFEMGLLSGHRLFLYGIATLLVIASHMKTVFPLSGMWLIPAAFNEFGMVGVEIFLMLAGFGLYGSLSRNPDIGRFYKRRLLRVFLPAFIIAAVYSSLGYVSLGHYISGLSMIAYFWNGKSFWYVAFILVMYAIYPLIFRLQRRSQKLFIIISGVISAVMLVLCVAFPIHTRLQRAISRVPAFLAGCIIAPYVLENKKLPSLTVPVLFVTSAVLAAARYYISMDSYGIRAAAFLPFSALLLIIFSRMAEFLAKDGVRSTVYRFCAFMGTVSLETYLLYERVQYLFMKTEAYANPTFSDMLKIDISAAIVSILGAYLITLLTARLISDFGKIPVPKVNRDIT